MRAEDHSETGQSPRLADARRCPRFKIDVEVKVYSHTTGLLLGRAVDISESGIAAILKLEVPLDEVVQLEFTLPVGPVSILALVRQRNAFRYGFQFIEQGPEQTVIAQTCRQLSVDQFLDGSIP